MNRRNFLKSLGKVCGAAVVAPAVLLKARPKSVIVPRQNLTIAELKKSGKYRNEHIYLINHPSFGVSDKDLRELIDATLKDLPQGFLEDAWS